MVKLSDEQLRGQGVSESLLRLRAELNRQIAAGICYCHNFRQNRLIQCEYAFISNPNGYYAVFLQGCSGEILCQNLTLVTIGNDDHD